MTSKCEPIPPGYVVGQPARPATEEELERAAAEFRRTGYADTLLSDEPEMLSLATDAGMSRWPSRDERLAHIEKYRDFIEDRMMSTAHPRNYVVELMAKAMRGVDMWQDLPADEKDTWRRRASDALSAIEPAVNWGHFVNHSEAEVIY